MPTLSVTCSHFPTASYSPLNKVHKLTVSELECFKFAITVGLPHFAAGSPSSAHAATMTLYKALALLCSIEFTPSAIKRVPQYKNLDQTEQANLSYWVGMTFAAIAADRLLKVPRLVHAASMLKAKRLIKSPKAGKRLADLVGDDVNGNWHVVEAKARQVDPGPQEKKKWRDQAKKTVETIDNKAPTTRSYCLTYIQPEYALDLVDPPSRQTGLRLVVEGGRMGFLRWYYEPLMTLLRGRAVRRSLGRRVAQVALVGFDLVRDKYVFLGLDGETATAISNNGIPCAIDRIEDEDFYLGTDGVVVLVSPTAEVQ